MLVEGRPRRSDLITTLSSDPELARRTVARPALRAERPARAPRSLGAAVRMTRVGDLCTAAVEAAPSGDLLRGALLRHARRVGDYAAGLALEVREIPHQARAAGPRHDIGRVGLPLAAATAQDVVFTGARLTAHHASAAAAMVRAWNLPGTLSAAVESPADPSRSPRPAG